MRIRIKYLIFLILLMLPITVFAAGGVTVGTTSVSVAPGGTGSFNIVATNAAGKVTITSNDLSIATVDKSNEWIENGTLSVVVTGKKTGNTKITIVVDAATFDSEVIKKTYTVNVRVKSNNNNLKSLSLNNGTLSPGFNANTVNYKATINAANTTINAAVADNTAKISGTGSKTLKYGKNTFKVVVTSEAGTTKTYNIEITRPDNRSTNNNLKSLSTSVGSISFNKSTTSYSLNVASDVTSAKINAAVEDSKASFVSGYGSRTVNLKYGKNSVLVKVKAENEKVKTYTININREDNRSTNTNLSSLSISAGSISFYKDTINYNVSVPFETTKVEIIANPEDSKSTVVINSPDLFVGDNVATIVVTSESGATKTYTLNIKRLTEAEKMSDNNNVTSIDIFGHDFDLLDDVFEYDITVGSSEDDLLFNILMEDDRANYVIEGNEKIKDGSVVTIKAISESGIEKEYKFNINKEAIKTQKSESDLLLYVVACLICLVIGYGMGFVTPKVIEKLRPVPVGNVKTSNVLNTKSINKEGKVVTKVVKKVDVKKVDIKK